MDQQLSMDPLKKDIKLNLKPLKRGLETNFIPMLEKISNGNECNSKLIRIHKDKFTIGRKQDNDEVILDVLISRNHCELFLDKDNNNWFIKNLSSVDTLLNSNPIARYEAKMLKSGDILQLSLSDNYKYQFTLIEKEYENAKFPRGSSDNHLTDSRYKGTGALVGEENEKTILEKQFIMNELKLKQDIEKLLEEEKVAKNCNQTLNNQVAELMKEYKTVNLTEIDAEQRYTNLMEQFQEEQKMSDIKLAEEKEKWRKILEESKKEKKLLETTMAEKMEEWRLQLEKQKQEEWQKKKDSILLKEKLIQSKLANEKSLLEQKCKELAKALKEKEEPEQLQKAETINLIDSVVADENKTDKEKNSLTILDTIDLTEDEPAISLVDQEGNPNAIIDKVHNIMDEQLTCSICSELFVTAMTLECTHTFCRTCIDKWFKKRKDCPNCRAKVNTMTRSLVLDNFIEKMIESLSPEEVEKRKLLIEERKNIPKVNYKKKASKNKKR